MTLDFRSATLQQVEVLLPDGKYVLREPTGSAEIAYRAAMFARSDIDGTGKVTAAGLAECEPVLVANCLFRDGEASPVGEDFVKGLPSRIMKQLFDWCREAQNSDPKASSSTTSGGSS